MHEHQTVEEAGAAVEDHASFTLRDVIALLRHRWLPLLLSTLLGLGVALLLTALQPRLYTSTATAVVNPTVTDNPAAALSQDTLAKSRATQYKELAQSSLVAERARTLVDFPLTGGQALGAVTVAVPAQTALIDISVEWGEPRQAAQLADAWIEALTAEADALVRDDTRDPQVRIDRMLPATVPQSHSSPREALNLAIGGIVGLGLGLGLALLLEIVDRRVRGAEDLERMGLVPIGMIPLSPEMSEGHRVLPDVAAEADALGFRVREAFNELRINLLYMNPDNPPRIITITSASPADGKSTVAANLAVTLARAGTPVVLVDADLRRPTIASTFHLPAGAGLSDVVVGRADLADVVHTPAGFDGLLVLPTGQIPPNPTELLSSDRFRQALEALAETHTVIVDAPPLLAVSDAAVMATRLDGALVVVNVGSTTRDDIREAIARLERVHAPLLGAVMNRVPMTSKESAYAYYSTHETAKGTAVTSPQPAISDQ